MGLSHPWDRSMTGLPQTSGSWSYFTALSSSVAAD